MEPQEEYHMHRPLEVLKVIPIRIPTSTTIAALDWVEQEEVEQQVAAISEALVSRRVFRSTCMDRVRVTVLATATTPRRSTCIRTHWIPIPTR